MIYKTPLRRYSFVERELFLYLHYIQYFSIYIIKYRARKAQIFHSHIVTHPRTITVFSRSRELFNRRIDTHAEIWIVLCIIFTTYFRNTLQDIAHSLHLLHIKKKKLLGQSRSRCRCFVR